jgi:hypothetical protein
MTRAFWLLIVAGLLIGLAVSTRFVSMAQNSSQPGSATLQLEAPAGGAPESPKRDDRARPGDLRPAFEPELRAGSGAPTLQESLLRPYRFPFSRPTSLKDVCAHFKQTLKAPVVIDLAALDRQNVEPNDTVQLELEGVRLKTGLKLLLDQLGLTYRIEPEDNLLIVTDREGSENPFERIWAELRALHRDLHEVQDSIDELRGSTGDERFDGPKVRKPTIIEEMPEAPVEPAENASGNPGRAGSGTKPPGKTREKPGLPSTPEPPSRPPSQRIPL